jgi:hypothetical protein
MERRRAIRINTEAVHSVVNTCNGGQITAGEIVPGLYTRICMTGWRGMCPPCLRITAAFALFRAPGEGKGLNA